MRIHFCVTVWGTHYVEQFDRYCLATLLTDENFVRVARDHECCLFIYTRDEDVDQLTCGRNLSRVQTMFRVVYVTDEAAKLKGGIDHWTPWHRAYANAFAADAALIIIVPDVVYLSDALARIVQKLSDGTPLVEFPIPQVTQELVRPFLDQRARDSGGRIVLDDADVLSIFEHFVHPKHACALIDAPCFSSHPEYILTRAEPGFRVRELGSQPFAIVPRRASVDIAFVSTSAFPQDTALECLGLSMEAMLKYHQLYSFWLASGHRRARLVNLASWAAHFRKPGTLHYSAAGSVINGARRIKKTAIGGVAELRSIYHVGLVNISEAVYVTVQMLGGRVSESVLQFALLPLVSARLRRRIRRHERLTVFIPKTLNPEHLQKITSNRRAAEQFFAQHCVSDELFVHVDAEFALVSSNKAGGLDETIYSEILEVAENDPTAVRGKITASETIMDGSRKSYFRLYVFDPRATPPKDYTLEPRTVFTPAAQMGARLGGLSLSRRATVIRYRAFACIPVLRALAYKIRSAYQARNKKTPFPDRDDHSARRTRRSRLKQIAVIAYQASMHVPVVCLLVFRARNAYRDQKGKPTLNYQEERRMQRIAVSPTMKARIEEVLPKEVDLITHHARVNVDVCSTITDPEMYERLSISCLLRDTQAIVTQFNKATCQTETPVSHLLDQLQERFDDGIDWSAAQNNRNPLIRIKVALRAASDGNLQMATDICEPLWCDPKYREHSLESLEHRDAYARAMGFKARSSDRQGQLIEALGYYLRALRIDPERRVLACRAANILWQLDRVTESLKLMRVGIVSEVNASHELASSSEGNLQRLINELTAWDATWDKDTNSSWGMPNVSNL